MINYLNKFLKFETNLQVSRNILQNSFVSASIAEKPRFAGNCASKAFGTNFLETKRKSVSRNP
jgi:hypothetical protein